MCIDSDTWGRWKGHDLLVDFDGGTDRIAQRGTALIGRWLVVHGGGAIEYEFPRALADYHPPWTSVGFLRVP